MATRSSRHGDGGARVVVGSVAGVRGRGSGGEEWRRGTRVRLQGRVEGPGRGRWRLEEELRAPAGSVGFHRAAWRRGEEDDRGGVQVGWTGPEEVGLT